MRSSTLPFSLRCADAAPSPLPVRPQNASAFLGNASLDFASCANQPYAEVRIVRLVALPIVSPAFINQTSWPRESINR